MRHSPRLLTAGLALAALVSGTALAAPAAQAAGDPLAGLKAGILSDLRGATASHLAVRADVAGVGNMGVLSTSMLAPASTQKVVTTGTALMKLGPDFHFVTRIATDDPRQPDGSVFQGGTLTGDLVVLGGGDPTLTRARLDALAAQLAEQGLRHVHGGLYVDDGRYGHDTWAPGWHAGFVPGETGPVDAFTVDANAWRRDGGFLANPTIPNLELFRAALRAHGIGVAGGDRVGRPARMVVTELARDTSPSLAEIVEHTLKYSDNFYAEMLLREVGATTYGVGTRATGVRAVRSQAAALHVPLGTFYDGSGLSYYDRQAPTTLVSWLHAVAGTPAAAATLTAGLPVSCMDGTLQHRLCGPWLSGRIHAKTGTLTGVRTLAGYTRTASGRLVTFTVMLSGIRNMSVAGARMDAAVARLARYTG